MEAFQNVVQDFQYKSVMNAGEDLDPTCELIWPTENDNTAYLVARSQAQPESFTFNVLTLEPVGFWLFVKYIQNNAPIALERMRFLEAVVKFRHSESRAEMAEQARLIWNEFLSGNGPTLEMDSGQSKNSTVTNAQARRRSSLKDKKRRRSTVKDNHFSLKKKADYEVKCDAAVSFDSTFYKSTIFRSFDLDRRPPREDFRELSELERQKIEKSMQSAKEFVVDKKGDDNETENVKKASKYDNEKETNRLSVRRSSTVLVTAGVPPSSRRRRSSVAMMCPSSGRRLSERSVAPDTTDSTLRSKRPTWAERVLVIFNEKEKVKSSAHSSVAAAGLLGTTITTNMVDIVEPAHILAQVHFEIHSELTSLQQAANDTGGNNSEDKEFRPQGALREALFNSVAARDEGNICFLNAPIFFLAHQPSLSQMLRRISTAAFFVGACSYSSVRVCSYAGCRASWVGGYCGRVPKIPGVSAAFSSLFTARAVQTEGRSIL